MKEGGCLLLQVGQALLYQKFGVLNPTTIPRAYVISSTCIVDELMTFPSLARREETVCSHTSVELELHLHQVASKRRHER